GSHSCFFFLVVSNLFFFSMLFLEPPAIPSLCMTPMDKGLCRAKETRFFYNYSTGRCRPFNYSGCGGNENNFTSRKSCLRICKKGMGNDTATENPKR
uniref:BPTI/Kunitz inhibitor domain-containing protein n=1 Tax=Anas zonorhyncha TaxID=75864 RepID=A0A8B9ZTL8_9AVES